MATYTTYKNLEKPLTVEKYDIGVANKNNDVIDSELHKLDLKNQSQDDLLATKESLNQEISRATDAENELSTKVENMLSDFTEKIDWLNYLVSEGKSELFKIVDVLPTSDIFPTKIYLLLNDNESEDNKYLEYVYVGGEYVDGEYINGQWENIGVIKIENEYETDSIEFTQLFDQMQN